MFLEEGLDRANQIESLQQIRRFVLVGATGFACPRGSEFHYPERQGFANDEAIEEPADVRPTKGEGLSR